MSSTAIILAAGKSTRMKSKRAKPLHEICGKPMLDYVLQACFGAGCERVMVVVGHGKEEVMAEFGQDRRITWIEQTEQLGTGHAARMCEAHLRQHPKGDVFILAGDGPLIRAQVLMTLQKAHHDEHADASMATAILDDPTGYGRVIRDATGNFVEIVEQIDCTPEQREIREVFPSYYCLKVEELLFALSRLKNENKKREYYLTDIYGILRNNGKKVLAVQAVTAEDVLSVNSREQQTQVDAIMQERIQRQFLESGVTIVSGINTYIEAGVSIGPDTIIRPFTYIGRDSGIGSDCTIGPFVTIPRESIVPEGTTVAAQISTETSMLNAFKGNR
ncbi:MAG: N-acetylglucosamine-phosphate uridylyltransferase/acetyltransferase [Phycisphaerales bacterium]|jgi:bifunctional UDP-N-acetylglucosamine pyrophosphorylase/glucosamine-1-phosphate N-acetyltransferase|nr:N-acetylglucosamine-phosphate uridylyltransferase/acetyltransferase [Phycisphaerales bacterium]